MKISSRRGFLGTVAVVAPFVSQLKSNAIFAQKKECSYTMFISG
ncbi:MAG TPA: hypothetical protein VGQ04_00090 [Chitinophagaceae bacterium]|nr:hypothetical protein [Chitinophagaceae bacterium]